LPDDKADSELNSWQFRKDTPFINSLYDIRMYAGAPLYSCREVIDAWRGHDTANGRIAFKGDDSMATGRINGDARLDLCEWLAGRGNATDPVGDGPKDRWQLWELSSYIDLQDEVNHIRLIATRSHGQGSPRSRADHELYGSFLFGGAVVWQ
jgi:hypothetical protein